MDVLEKDVSLINEDAISRQAVERIITDMRDSISVGGYWAILERMKKLSPINPLKKVKLIRSYMT